MTSYILSWIGVFFAVILADICWTFYFIKIEERKSLAAGLWGAGVYLCGAIAIVSYTTDKTLLIPELIGAVVGTWGTVEYKKRKEKNEIR
jgi:hypothetical protein